MVQHQDGVELVAVDKGDRADGEVDHARDEPHHRQDRLVETHQQARNLADLRQQRGLEELPVEQVVDAAEDVDAGVALDHAPRRAVLPLGQGCRHQLL